MTDMNSKEYRAQIDRLIREATGEIVLNGSHAHASIIVERMFSHAKECMEILTRRFDPRIYGTANTVEQASLFLGEPERVCRILVEEFNEEASGTHPFLVDNRAFVEAGNLQIRRIPEHVRDIIKFNFAAMDTKGFRFEEDKTEAIAFARFGDDAEAFLQRLRSLFQNIWKISSPVPLTEREPA